MVYKSASLLHFCAIPVSYNFQIQLEKCDLYVYGIIVYRRILEAQIRECIQRYPVLTLTGPRQSGKTTLVQSCLPSFAYANLERPDLRKAAQEDPRGFLASFPPPVILDEIQRIPELPSWIQVQADEAKANGLYVITGSNQPGLGAAISQSLAGRTAILRLLPLSLEEMAAEGLPADRDECLVRGFLPRIHQGGLAPFQAYMDYLATYVERDVRQLINIRDLSRFELFLRLLAGRVGQLLNLHALSAEVGVSSTTLEHWLSALEASYIVFRLRPWHANLGKRLVKQPKLYFLEPGLAAALLQIETPAQASRDPLIGGLFENVVVVEFLKAQWNRGLPASLSFYRDSRGNEVDIIIEKNRLPHPVEIKASRTFSPDFLKGIRHFSSLGIETGPGAVVYGGDEELDLGGTRVLGFSRAACLV